MAVIAQTNAAAVSEAFICPICRKTRPPRQIRKLFDVPVCKKCIYKFTNRRQFAYILDLVWLYFASWGLGTALAAMFPELVDDRGPSRAMIDAFWIGWSWVLIPVLFAFKDGFRGQSPGKWLTGVQAVDQSTRKPIGPVQSFKRNVLTAIPILPLIIAFTLVKGRRLGDGWAKTEVTWKKYQHQLPFDRRGIVCTKCGYDLTGNLSGRCPECGLDFTRRNEDATVTADAKTSMQVAREVPQIT